MKAKRNAAARWAARAPRAAIQFKLGVMNPRTGKAPELMPSELQRRSRNYIRGISRGVSRYRRAWRGFRKALQRVILPRRYPKGDRRNVRRTIVVCAAMHQEKVRRMTLQQRTEHKPRACALCNVKVERKEER